jgi:putative ABC transport system ATP-binding protein
MTKHPVIDEQVSVDLSREEVSLSHPCCDERDGGERRGSNGVMIIQLNGVSKVYRAGDVDVVALQNMELTISRQRFTMVVGPSGSGKTTLLNLIGCIDVPTSGRIEIDGREIGTLNDWELTQFRAQKIGYIFQNFNLIPVLSALENVEYALLLTKISAAERQDATASMLNAVGLYNQRHQRPSQLSGGQKQRVAIARALVKRPSIVLADEPTANLDSQTGAAIVALMREMQSRFKTTFIFSTHDPHLMKHAEETFTIRDGTLVEHKMGAVQ